MSSARASSVGNTSVSVVLKARLAKTRTGVNSSATCSAEFMITEIAKSGRLRTASCTPTTFSTALPAIATMTSPAKSWLMCIACVAGVKAATNQSLVKAAATPAAPSTITVSRSDQRGGSVSRASPPARNDGSVKRKTASRTPAQMKLSARPCEAAGVWNACASVGAERIAAASTVSVAIIRARGES